MITPKRIQNSIAVPLLAGALLILFAIGAIFIGVVQVPADIIRHSFLHHLHIPTAERVIVPAYYDMVIWQLRLPRIIMSILAGASLAICGCVFQSIFRNPICDPYILGISSGASLGAAIAIILGWDVVLFGVTLPALVTAVLTLLLIMGVAHLRGRRNTETLLLTGIAINFLISAVITLLMVVHQQELQKIFFWTMGSLATTSWLEIGTLLPCMLLVTIILYYYAKDLNIIQLGNDAALSVGVNARRTTFVTLVAASLLIGLVVSTCGVIGFIGLIIPHISRLLFGSNNRRLFTCSMILGALFLLIADTLARVVAAPSELPVGSITALAGAPYFIYLLLRKR